MILFEVNDMRDISLKHLNLTLSTGADQPCLPTSGSSWSMVDRRITAAGSVAISQMKFFPDAVETSISNRRSVKVEVTRKEWLYVSLLLVFFKIMFGMRKYYNEKLYFSFDFENLLVSISTFLKFSLPIMNFVSMSKISIE